MAMETISFKVGRSEKRKLLALRSATKLSQSKILRGLIQSVIVPINDGQKNSDATLTSEIVAI